MIAMLDQYYYIDWFAMVFSMLAVWLLGNKSRWGFASFVLANLLWLIVGTMAGSYGIVIGNTAFVIMNARGFFRWTGPSVQITIISGAQS